MSKKLVGSSASAETKLMTRPNGETSQRSESGSAYWFQRQRSIGCWKPGLPFDAPDSRAAFSADQNNFDKVKS